jgi:Tfp pilus assembly protein PilF
MPWQIQMPGRGPCREGPHSVHSRVFGPHTSPLVTDGAMKSNSMWSLVATGLAGAGLFVSSGCSSLTSKTGGLALGKKRATPAPAQLGKVQADQYGRPLPGTTNPAGPAISESRPDISDETRSHVALAMGEMLESVGNLNAAQVQYEQALKSDPKSLSTALALARVYARQGRPEAALKVYQTAEKYHRRNPALFNDKGLLLADQKDWAAAIAALRVAIKLSPTESKYHNNLGMVLAAQGNYEDAYKEFREAVGAGPAHYNVALMLLQADRPVEARNHLERAIAAMPSLDKAQQLLDELDERNSNSMLATSEREVEVDLDRTDADRTESAESDTHKIALEFDPEIEHASATTEPQAAKPAATRPAAESDRTPWSRRWVPPKWLR